MKDRIRLRPTSIANAIVVDGDQTRHRFARHSHDFYVVGVFTRGGQMSHYGLSDFEVETGDVVFIPPGEVHDGRPNGGIKDPRPRSYRMAYMGPGVFDQLAASFNLRSPSENAGLVRNIVFKQDQLLAGAAAGFLQALTKATGLSDELVLAFGEFAGRAGHDRAGAPAAELAVRIRKRMDEGADAVCELSEELGLSRYALLRSFRSAYGLTPSDYRRHKRVERSLTLIPGNRSLTEIAFACGFFDQSHFIRDFKAVLGVTPGAYRQAIA
ncbi:AraC family transcriptional regulator [Hoeflea sp.]|uniref:helix-turn-helix transcriptional regulator n=1 Tax=Hoeflea sp. TaxID=1940281 RepID=UPI003748A0CF